jgi:signal transduction histidine kinase
VSLRRPEADGTPRERIGPRSHRQRPRKPAMRPDARRVVIHAGRNENREIVVSVRDTGPGFPGGTVEQLFEPFFSTKAEGTGMGLAISRSIIEAHGGTLAGENCDGGGACFTVRLPEAKEDKSTAA